MTAIQKIATVFTAVVYQQNSYPHFQKPPCAPNPMNTISFMPNQNQSTAGWDLVRLSKSKQSVDLCSNTLRAYHKAGLPFYQRGKVVFFSKTELAMFIRANQSAV